MLIDTINKRLDWNTDEGKLTVHGGGGGTTLVDANSCMGATVRMTGTYGETFTLASKTALASALSGATVTLTGFIPAGATVLALVGRVTTLITGATSVDVGTGTADLFADGIAVAAGTTFTAVSGVADIAGLTYKAATDLVLTAKGSNFTAGAMRVTLFYATATAPTS